MKVRSLWITRKGAEGYDEMPELLVAWDEISIDENPEGFEQSCKQALESVGSDVDEIRYLDIDVGHQVERTFERAVVTGEVTG
jgi:hypothetical protein